MDFQNPLQIIVDFFMMLVFFFNPFFEMVPKTYLGSFFVPARCVSHKEKILVVYHKVTARCVSHKENTLVVYHKGTVNFPCGIFSHKAFRPFQGPLWYFVI